MDGLRGALSEYAQNYANNRLLNVYENTVYSFLDLVINYLDIAFDEPNLFIYLYINGGSGCVTGDVSFFYVVNISKEDAKQMLKRVGKSFLKRKIRVYKDDSLQYNDINKETG